MATVNTGSVTPSAASDANTAYVTLQGNSWSDSNPLFLDVDVGEQWGVSSFYENNQDGGNYAYQPGNWNGVVGPLTADKAYVFGARCTFNRSDGSETKYGTSKGRKSGAVVATASTPTAGTPTATTCDIACNFYPNTFQSSAIVYLEYKKTTDVSWTQAGASATGQTGYAQLNISRSLTGLTPATQYQFRLQMTRDTSTGTTLTSATSTFTTANNTPSITTDAASNIANVSATLNATVDPNNVSGGANVYFQWDTVSPPTANTIASQNFTGDSAQAVAQGITGLTPSTLYYFRALATWGTDGADSGTILSFTTTADPAAEAAEEARMQVYEYKRKYGVILTAQPLFFTLQTPSGTNSNTFVVGATVGAADCLISKDGGAFAQTTNQPATLGNGYTLILTAAEMQANEIDIIIKDAAGGPDFRDAHLRVITHLQLGSVDIDAATGAKANTTAITATGYGSGHGIAAVAGATGQDINGVLAEMVLRTGLCLTTQSPTPSQVQLDASASASNDWYNGAIVMIVSGTGAGQSRYITDYVGATQLCSLNRAWTTAPASGDRFIILGGDDPWGQAVTAELSALPSATVPTFSQMLQFLYQRFRFKRTQTAVLFSMLKADDSTPLGTGGVDDDGTIQTHEKMS